MFEDSKFLSEDVLTHKLPKELFKELTVFLKSADKKRKSKYGFLVSHDNHGKNSYNETHTHAGILSGVIYYTDCFNCPTEFHNLNFYGKSKDVLIFPSDTKHGVKKQNTNKTRITFAFNLYAV